MDPVTHGLVGATCAHCFSDKESYRTASFVGFVAALAPDLDVFLGSSSDPLLTLELHRHFTHSLLFIPFGSLIVAGLFWWLIRKKLTFKTTYLFSVIGYATAGFMDSITSYGVHLFWPFLDERYALNIISVFDPLFTIIILSLFSIAIYKRNKMWSGLIIGWIVLYLSLGAYQKGRVIEAVQNQTISTEHIVAKPTIGNQILWSVRYVKDDRVCGLGVRAGLFSSIKIYQGECIPLLNWKQDYAAFEGTVLYDDIRRFSMLSDGYLIQHPDHPHVIGDARYSMLPTTLSPLWGITVDTTKADQHVTFDTYRDAGKEIRNEFLDMLFQ